MSPLRRDQVAIGLVAAMLVALEIVWTRIFSAEFFYSFAFLVVSLAVFGLGLGALSLRFWPAWITSPQIAALLASGTAAIGPAAVTRLPIEFGALGRSGGDLALLAAGVGLLLLPYLAGGACCAALLRRHRANAAQLYAADLVGAAGGGAAAIAAMNVFGVPTAAVLCCIPGALAGWGPGRYQRTGVLALLAALGGAALAADAALVPKAPTKAPVIAERWDALGRIQVFAHSAAVRGIDIDGAANMLLHRVRGDWREGLPATAPEFALDLRPLVRALAPERVLVVGAGGGSEVMQAKWGGAQHVDAVEVNAGLNKMLTRGAQAAFFGHLYESAGVEVHSADARVYARQHPAAFDLIISRSSNTFAALSSGAFALAENYLFTVEAFADFYRALTADGVLLIEHQVYVPRLTSAALAALRALGLAAESHLAVYDLPTQRRQVLVLGRQPLASSLVHATLPALFAAADPASRILHPTLATDHLISRIVADGWEAHWATAPIDISPTTDDRPFVAQMGRWDRWDAGSRAFEFAGFPLARLLVSAVLIVVVAVGVPLLLLPRWRGQTGLAGAAWLYFAAIGMGYMLIEVVWIQQYSLLLGHSAYTFPIVLLALLLSSGAGSFCSQRGEPWWPFVFVAAWTAAHLVLFPHVVSLCGRLDWGVRVVISCALIAPPGFFMGMPFPRAVRAVGECIDWGFAVNGVASVFGAALAVFIALHWGFAAALGAAICCYLGALLLLRRMLVINRAPSSCERG